MHVTGVSIPRISVARSAAFEVLQAVWDGAHASDTLLDRAYLLERRDAALASQIVFGCLRHQAQLDHLILHYSSRPISQVDPPVLIALRTAIFQLRYLDRIPPHAAVQETVEIVKRHRRAAAGFTNAVLRKVDRKPISWPDLSTELSCPAWLLGRWTAHFGPERARSIALAALREPARYIRVQPGAARPADLDLEETAIEGCFRLRSPLPAGVRAHDISSQAILPLLDLDSGHRYLDLCAAPGNKTLQALERAPAFALACDISPKRIREIPPICPRLVLDATQPLPFSCCFDRIFIDAPCSGTGTLGRNPEIKWRVQGQDFARFGERQIQILARAIPFLAPGGKLLYATCSLETEENEQVIRRILATWPGLRLERETWRLPGQDEGDGFYAAVLSYVACYDQGVHPGTGEQMIGCK